MKSLVCLGISTLPLLGKLSIAICTIFLAVESPVSSWNSTYSALGIFALGLVVTILVWKHSESSPIAW
jgi:hypothetical protein